MCYPVGAVRRAVVQARGPAGAHAGRAGAVFADRAAVDGPALRPALDACACDPLVLRVAPRLQSGDYPFLREAVLAGLGVVLLPRYAVWKELRDGLLQEVLPEFEPEGVGNAIYLLTAPNRFPSMAARTLAAFVQTHIERHHRDWLRPVAGR